MSTYKLEAVWYCRASKNWWYQCWLRFCAAYELQPKPSCTFCSL